MSNVLKNLIELSNSDDSSWREPVAEAIEGLDRMTQLLDTTLDLAEAAGGALRWTELEIDLSENITFDGDISLMSRVVGNLLDNELTHLPDGCRIRIRLSLTGTRALLRIEDNGPGFSPDVRQRAFDRFVKGKQSRGRGLGLAFVDAVVRAHGGEVGLSDRENGGAELVLSLPISV